MRIFGDLWCRGYPMPKPLADCFVDMVLNIGLDRQEATYYIAYLDGEPVATSFTLFGAGVAGLYAVTVLPEARGRGLGTEMSLHPLREARKRGYHIGVLDATQQGYGIYKRIGFIDVGRPKMYIPSSPEQQAFSEKAKDFILTPRN
jgi:predicted acetyltransferase